MLVHTGIFSLFINAQFIADKSQEKFQPQENTCHVFKISVVITQEDIVVVTIGILVRVQVVRFEALLFGTGIGGLG